MASASVQDFVRNRFSLEPQGSATAVANQQISFVLAESALIDTKSLRLFMDITTNSATEGSSTVYSRLPADLSSLVEKMEVYVQGTMVSDSSSEYNTVARILKIAEGNRPRDESVDRCLSHGAIIEADAVENEQLVLHEFHGFLGENSARFIPSDILGSIVVKLTLAGNHVLVPKEAGVALGDNLTADGKIAATRLNYTVSNIRMTFDSIIPPTAFVSALKSRLASGEIRMNYKARYTYALGGVGTAFTHRFGVSTGSLDRLYAVIRDGNNRNTGIKSYDLTDSSADGRGDTHVANFARFRSYSNGNNFRYRWEINSVPMPAYDAKAIEAMADLHYGANKVGQNTEGTLVSDQAWWHDGLAVVPLILNCPDDAGVASRSGFSTRGQNSACVFRAFGMTTPTANAATGETAERESFIVAETTQQLCITAGRQVVVNY
jgi:hypothetical protein